MKEVNPKETSRASAFEMWMSSPMSTYKFLNLMVMWGKYRRSWFRTTLPISFQFHHVQMDGDHAALFFAISSEGDR